jgi:hypothetical protein
MDDLSHAYLYCELLDLIRLIMITLCVTSPHIQMHENVLQNVLYDRLNFIGIEARFQRGFEKKDMPIILMVESTIIVLSITKFELALIPMFFHFDSLKECKSRSLQLNFSTTTISIIVTAIRHGQSNHERQLMTTNGENQYDQDFFLLAIN